MVRWWCKVHAFQEHNKYSLRSLAFQEIYYGDRKAVAYPKLL
jgi:hypothetical protein